MQRVIGLITTNYATKFPTVLSSVRPVASLPFLGRYRVLDFALSNMVNAGIRTVGMILPYNYRSIIDHVGSGRDWDLNRKKGGLFMLAGTAFGTSRKGGRFLIRDLVQNKAYLDRDSGDDVIVSSASFVYNADFKELVAKHRQSNANITVLCKKATRDDVDVTGFKVADGRVVSAFHGVQFGDVEFLDCFVVKREFLLELIEWYKQTDYLDLFEAMAEDFGRVHVQVELFESYSVGVFNKDTYFQANMDMLSLEITKELFPVERPIRTKGHDNAPAKFEKGSHVSNSRISGSCRIYGTVTNSILGRNVVVESGATINNAIVMQGCVIQSGARVEHAIVDRNNVVPAGFDLRGTPKSLYIKEKSAQ